MKALLRLIVALVVLVGIAIGVALLYLDQIAKTGIERGATYALGVETTVDGVSIRPRTGEFSMNGLAVANPPGFDVPYFLRIASARMVVPLARLMEDTVRVANVTISDVDVALLRAKGANNYDKILEHLKRFESGSAPESAESSGGKQLIIDELLITDVAAKVTVDLLAKASTVDVVVPEIRLKNVGSKSAGVTSAELTSIITKAVLDAILRSGGIPRDIAKDLKGQLAGLGAVKLELPAGLGSVANQLLGGNAEDGDGKAGIGKVLDGFLGGKKSE